MNIPGGAGGGFRSVGAASEPGVGGQLLQGAWTICIYYFGQFQLLQGTCTIFIYLLSGKYQLRKTSTTSALAPKGIISGVL